MKHRLPFASALLLASALLSTSALRAADLYAPLKEIQIGGEGGWDYASVDDAGRALYVTHGTRVVAIDLTSGQVAGEIADTQGVHGFAIASDLGRGFASNGRANNVSVVDLKNFKTLSKVATGENPDAILFEPSRKEVYAFNGHGKSATVFEAESGKVIATIPLAGKPEFATCDPEAGRVYCNLEDKSEVVAIDIAKHEVVNEWPISPGEEPSGMAIDLAHHRLFLGCGNKLMVMLDSKSGKVVASVPIGDHVDACAFDPATNLAFSSCGDGTLTIAKETSPDKLEVVQTVTTEHGARTMALDPTTHNVYLPTAQFEEAPPAAAGEKPKRPAVVPDTFKVLVYGTNAKKP